MELLGEVISVTEVARGLQETALRRTEIELNVSRIMQAELAKLDKTLKAHYNDVRESVKRAQNEYSNAVKAIPRGFKSLVMGVGRAIVGMISRFAKKISGGQVAGSSAPQRRIVADAQSLAFGRLLFETVEKFSAKFTEFIEKSSKDTNSSSLSNAIEQFEAFNVTFGTYLTSVRTGRQSTLRSKVARNESQVCR